MKKIAALFGSVVIALSNVSISDINAVSTEIILPHESVEAQSDEVDLTLYSVEVVKLVNQERAKAGLPELMMFPRLSKAANIRIKETTEKWSHERPDGRSSSTIITDLSIRWNAYGENIAYGQRSPQEVVRGWMNSEGHKKNILSANYKYIGVGVTQKNGVLYWTQEFLGVFPGEEYPEAFYARAFGDINSDGKIDSSDASLILKDYASVSSNQGYVLSTSQRAKSDVTGDERMDSVDASVMLSIYAKNST